MQAAWSAHCKTNTLTRRSCPEKGPYRYEKQYEVFIMENYKFFFKDNWQRYDNVKSFYNDMSKRFFPGGIMTLST